MATSAKPARNNNKCGVIVFRKQDNKFLIVKNRTSQFWGFPKGHQEPNETTVETAIRELHEEAGIKIGEKDIIYHIKKRSWYLYVVLLDNVFVRIDNNEICAYKWVNYDSFISHNMSKGTSMFLSFELRRNRDESWTTKQPINKSELQKIEETLSQMYTRPVFRRYSLLCETVMA